MKASKKLIGASVALVAALAVSVGSTYAWFTTSDTATVSGISATVTTANSSLEVAEVNANGALISGGAWGYNLTVNSDNFKNAKLDAVTYMTEADTTHTGINGAGFYKYGTGTYATETYQSSSYATSTPGTDYVEFYIGLRSQEALKVYLGSGSSLTSTGKTDGMVKAWKTAESSVYGAALTEGASIEAAAQNAARVGFDTVDKLTSGSTSYAGGFTKIWAPHEEYAGGATSGTSQNSSVLAGYHSVTNILAKDYEQTVLGVSAAELAVKYTNAYYTATKGITAEGKDKDDSLLITLGEEVEGYHYAYVHVVLWIEGTDGDCFNNIFGDAITAVLSFEAGANS